MKIKEIRAMRLEMPQKDGPRLKPRRPSWVEDAEVANPMSKYPRFKRHRRLWLPKWGGLWVKVTAEDGTWGAAPASYGRPVAAIIDDHLAPMLEGEDCFAIEKLWDMMFRLTKPYGSEGLAMCAISGIDMALWDLVGKLNGAPVYELLGGPARDRIFCYATGNDTDWQLELGFKAVKLACPYGPADGLWGLKENENLVARTRELVGNDVDIMLDCYMAFDVDYTIRLARRLRPYDLKWIEEFLIPEDLDGYLAVRRAVNWVSLAGVEHWFSPWRFREAIEMRALDILQPDLFWVGGITACLKICHMADLAGLMVCLHGGANSPYGLHLTYAMPNMPWAEYFIGSPPGVPLEEAQWMPGAPIPKDSYVAPSKEPGFGVRIKEEWLKPFWGS
ncbi:MAG: enolase C-terminal domain-like protein [Candidatus Bathyarchaeia archaeon]